MYRTTFFFFFLTIIILPIYAESDKVNYHTIKVTSEILEPQYQSETVKVYSKILAPIITPDPPIVTTDPPTVTPGSGSGSSSSGSSSGGSAPTHKIDPLSGVIPKWIGTVVYWWNYDKIADSEFIGMMTFLLDENIIPSDYSKPDRPIGYLSSSIKQLFMLWMDNKLAESNIVRIIDQYRHNGIW